MKQFLFRISIYYENHKFIVRRRVNRVVTKIYFIIQKYFCDNFVNKYKANRVAIKIMWTILLYYNREIAARLYGTFRFNFDPLNM